MELNFTREEVETLYYSLAQAEMMWRRRSHNPAIDNESECAESPEEFEVTCRAEMKRYRMMQKKLAEMMTTDFWKYETEFRDGVE